MSALPNRPRVKRGPKNPRGRKFENPERTNRIQPMNFYMGQPADRLRRGEALDQLAWSLGLPNRSQMIQQIADGELKVVKP